MNVLTISNTIANLTSYNALSAMECCLLGLDTPLIEEFGLCEYKGVGNNLIETYKESLILEVKDQMKALNKARNKAGETVVGTYLIGGMTVPSVQNNEPTIEEIKKERTFNVNW